MPSYLPNGWFDTVSADGIASGWACDPNDFSVPLEIHFYVDGPSGAGGSYVGSAVANVAREPGVANACGGHASHGFAFSLPPSLWTGIARTLYAYAINIGPAASNPLLSGSPQWFNLGPPPPPAEFWDENVLPPAEGTGSSGGFYSTTCPRQWKFGKELLRSQGPAFWTRRLYLYVVWCSNSLTGVITNYSHSVRTSHGNWCQNTLTPASKVTDGGRGARYVEIQAWVEVECASVPFSWPKHHDTLMMRIRYFPSGWYRTTAHD